MSSPKSWDILRDKKLLSRQKNKLEKILGAKKRLFIASSLAICLALFFGSVFVEKPKSILANRLFVGLESGHVSSISELDSLSNDFTDVTKFEVPNAKATVVYFPQVHKDPTTQPSDPKNDLAAQAQREIHDGLTKIVDNYGVKYVMDETDFYGPMPSDKVEKIKKGFSDISTFRKNVDNVIALFLKDGGSQADADKMKSDSEKYISKYERNIYLTGGAAVLAANDPNAVVYGSQNPATIAKATDQLQDIQYLETRISQLQPVKNPLANRFSAGSKGTFSVGSPSDSGFSSSQIANLLSQRSNNSSTNSIFVPAKSLAKVKSNQELQDGIDQAISSSKGLSTSESFEAKQMLSDRPVTNNPYSRRTDLANLQVEYNQKYADFMKIAKDQRSQEVSDNVEKMMSDNHQDKAVLVLGAQHQDQIVQGLNKKGISVVVVTTDKVKQYENSNPGS